MAAGYNLLAGTKYAIVVKCLAGLQDRYIEWRGDASSPTYADGTGEITNDGETWFTMTTDYMFEDWGLPLS
ncbi:hypothetical protein ES708_24492 [subsurface metagenome]